MDVGVLGAGTMGRNHVRLYSNMKKRDSVRVFDINTAALQDIVPFMKMSVHEDPFPDEGRSSAH